jgi:c-di-GMP-binding flagellar brake protein YcgR
LIERGYATVESIKRKSREVPNDYFLVYEHQKNEFMGRLLNMSLGGMMLVSEGPVEVEKPFSCRMKLPEVIYGHDFITFEAESRWCKLNNNTRMYETGYQFKNVSAEVEKMIAILMKIWSSANDNSPKTWPMKF